ncbi:MAG: acyl-CoA dehydrogenase [SAR202 cluster bacterium]|nr:acyl-CoA dehydrogenase [SAR202 cluster bacterium]
MDLGLNEVQQMLKSSAREFLARECPLSLVRAAEDDPTPYPAGLWRQMADLGWTGLAFPERYGGTGGSFLDLAVLLEEMGRALAPGPFFSTVVLGGLTILDAGSEVQKQEILPSLCRGELRLALAVTEATASWEPWGVEAAAVRQGNSYILNGVKLFVPDAQATDLLLVAARTSNGPDLAQGISLFLAPASSPGISRRRLKTIDGAQQYEVALQQVRVPASALLGAVGEGWPVVERALQRAAAAHCVWMTGGAQAVLDMTVEYVKQRTQFGRPVGAFQAVQHHCANMATDVESARHIAYQAAWRVSEGLPAQREVSMAKAWVTGACQRVCATAHQCHGGIGFTKEHNLQLYTRRAKAQELAYGDAHFHLELVVQEWERLGGIGVK